MGISFLIKQCPKILVTDMIIFANAYQFDAENTEMFLKQPISSLKETKSFFTYS